MTREEWITRYAAYMKSVAGLSDAEAVEVTNPAIEAVEQEAKDYGTDPDWTDPEGAADEELSYWTDDSDA